MRKRIFDRLREPSSMAGISALLLLVGVPPGMSEALVQTLAGAAALAAVVLPEGK